MLIPALFTIACGNGSSLIGPSDQIPNVAGSYTGTTTITFPELRYSASCATTTSVTQTSGGRISIAPLQLRGGECGVMSIPLGDATIDSTGSLGQSSGTYSESCGVYTWVASGGFFGRNLQGSFVYTSRTCYNMNVTINLTH